MVKFYTQYTRPEKKDFLEPGGGEVIVERGGYVTTKERVESMLAAGQRLMDYRNMKYDVPPGSDFEGDIDVDPTRRLDYDVADATQDLISTESRLDEQKKTRKKEVAGGNIGDSLPAVGSDRSVGDSTKGQKDDNSTPPV